MRSASTDPLAVRLHLDGQKLSAASSYDRAVPTSGSKTPAPKGTTGQTPRSEPKTVNPD